MENTHLDQDQDGIVWPDIKAMREHVGLTIHQFACKSKLDQNRIEEIESRHSMPNISELAKLFKALGYRLKIEIEPKTSASICKWRNNFSEKPLLK